MARVRHMNITTSWTQIGAANARIELRNIGSGTLYVNESEDDLTATHYHSITTSPGTALNQLAGKPTFIRATEAGSGWVVQISES